MQIICNQSDGYNIKVGKEYTVIKLEKKAHEVSAIAFTWPSYVEFKDDNGKICVAHASRFSTLDGGSLDKYIEEN